MITDKRSEIVFIVTGAAGMILTLMMEILTPLDVHLQDLFYDISRKEWIVDGEAVGPRFWFYNFPKIILFAFGFLLFLRVLDFKMIGRALPFSPREALYILICLAGIPLLVGLGKNITRVHCPSELRRYGGTEEYRRVISSEEKTSNQVRPHCFPAGHASGGFALFAFYFARRRRAWFAVPMAYGWAMGMYQILKGAHFLSHTLFTMFFALFFAAVLAPLFFPRQPQTQRQESLRDSVA
jgi:membrane-associated PAP2 superfamily phosphatase